MKRLLLSIYTVVFTLFCQAQALGVVKDNANYLNGIKNSEEDRILEPNYRQIEKYNSGYFLVRDIESVGIFTPYGKQLMSCFYDQFSGSTHDWHTHSVYNTDQSTFHNQQRCIFNLIGELSTKKTNNC